MLSVQIRDFNFLSRSMILISLKLEFYVSASFQSSQIYFGAKINIWFFRRKRVIVIFEVFMTISVGLKYVNCQNHEIFYFENWRPSQQCMLEKCSHLNLAFALFGECKTFIQKLNLVVKYILNLIKCLYTTHHHLGWFHFPFSSNFSLHPLIKI